MVSLAAERAGLASFMEASRSTHSFRKFSSGASVTAETLDDSLHSHRSRDTTQRRSLRTLKEEDIKPPTERLASITDRPYSMRRGSLRNAREPSRNQTSEGSKRMVQFNTENPSERLIEHRCELEAEIIAAVWFSVAECNAMKTDTERTAAALDRGIEVEEPRGLEIRTEEGIWLSYKIRNDAYNAVLGEQDRQKNKRQRERDHDRIANVYLEVSERNCLEAVERAKKDFEAAFEIYLEHRRKQKMKKSSQMKKQPSVDELSSDSKSPKKKKKKGDKTKKEKAESKDESAESIDSTMDDTVDGRDGKDTEVCPKSRKDEKTEKGLASNHGEVARVESSSETEVSSKSRGKKSNTDQKSSRVTAEASAEIFTEASTAPLEANEQAVDEQLDSTDKPARRKSSRRQKSLPSKVEGSSDAKTSSNVDAKSKTSKAFNKQKSLPVVLDDKQVELTRATDNQVPMNIERDSVASPSGEQNVLKDDSVATVVKESSSRRKQKSLPSVVEETAATESVSNRNDDDKAVVVKSPTGKGRRQKSLPCVTKESAEENATTARIKSKTKKPTSKEKSFSDARSPLAVATLDKDQSETAHDDDEFSASVPQVQGREVDALEDSPRRKSTSVIGHKSRRQKSLPSQLVNDSSASNSKAKTGKAPKKQNSMPLQDLVRPPMDAGAMGEDDSGQERRNNDKNESAIDKGLAVNQEVTRESILGDDARSANGSTLTNSDKHFSKPNKLSQESVVSGQSTKSTTEHKSWENIRVTGSSTNKHPLDEDEDESENSKGEEVKERNVLESPEGEDSPSAVLVTT